MYSSPMSISDPSGSTSMMSIGGPSFSSSFSSRGNVLFIYLPHAPMSSVESIEEIEENISELPKPVKDMITTLYMNKGWRGWGGEQDNDVQ